MQKVLFILQTYWKEIIFGAGSLSGAIYALVLLFVPNKVDWIPFAGQLWLFNAEVRNRQAHLRSLVATAERIIKGQRSAARQADIVEFIPKSRNPDEEEEKTVEVLPGLGPFFVSADGGVLYSYVQRENFPRKRSVHDFKTDLFETAALHNVNFETRLYRATPEDHYLETWKDGQYFLRTNIDYNLSGIPKLIKFDDAYQAVRDLKAEKRYTGPLCVCLGAFENEQYVFDDLLKEPPHQLWCGGTGSGKTNTVRSIILQLCLENRAADLNLYIIDLKKDLSTYISDLPHVTRVARDADSAMQVMRDIAAERERRDTLLDKHKRTSWSHWNKSVPPNEAAWPAIICVIDELQMLMLHNPKKKEFNELNWDTMALGRRACVLMMEITHVPNKKVITLEIKANMQTRGSFYLDGISSQLIMDDWSASKIANHPGRAVFKQASTRYELQTPLVASQYGSWFKLPKDEQDEHIVRGIRHWVNIIKEKEGAPPWALGAFAEWGRKQEKVQDLKDFEVDSEWRDVTRLYYLDYNLLQAELAHQYQFGGQKNVATALKKYSGKEFVLDGTRLLIKQYKRKWWLLELTHTTEISRQTAEISRQTANGNEIAPTAPPPVAVDSGNGNGHEPETAPVCSEQEHELA